MNNNNFSIRPLKDTIDVYIYPKNSNIGNIIFHLTNKKYSPRELVDKIYEFAQLSNLEKNYGIQIEKLLDGFLNCYKIENEKERKIYHGFLMAKRIADL